MTGQAFIIAISDKTLPINNKRYRKSTNPHGENVHAHLRARTCPWSSSVDVVLADDGLASSVLTKASAFVVGAGVAAGQAKERQDSREQSGRILQSDSGSTETKRTPWRWTNVVIDCQ